MHGGASQRLAACTLRAPRAPSPPRAARQQVVERAQRGQHRGRQRGRALCKRVDLGLLCGVQALHNCILPLALVSKLCLEVWKAAAVARPVVEAVGVCDHDVPRRLPLNCRVDGRVGPAHIDLQRRGDRGQYAAGRGARVAGGSAAICVCLGTPGRTPPAQHAWINQHTRARARAHGPGQRLCELPRPCEVPLILRPWLPVVEDQRQPHAARGAAREQRGEARSHLRGRLRARHQQALSPPSCVEAGDMDRLLAACRRRWGGKSRM